MFFHVQKLINPIAADEPDPAAANALQEGLGELCSSTTGGLDGSQMAKNFQGPSPANDGSQLEATAEPSAGGPIKSVPERPELKESVEQIAGMTP